MYADDSTLYATAKNTKELNEHLTSACKPITTWIRRNNMLLNIEKTECMIFHSKNKSRDSKEFSVKVDNANLNSVPHHKLLGVYLDNKLTFETHINKLCSKLHQQLFLFNRIKYLLPQYAKCKYFNGFVQPHIDYGCTIWGSCNKMFLVRVHKVMKLFGRSILNVKNKQSMSTVNIFKNLKWMPIDERIKYFKCIQMYNIQHGLAPTYLCDMFQFVNNVHKRVTRQSVHNNFYIPKFKTNYGQRSFHYSGTALWNNLNNNLKSEQNSTSFRSNYVRNLYQTLYNNSHFAIDT